MTIPQQLEKALADNTALQTRITELESTIAAAPKPELATENQTLTVQLNAANSRITELTTQTQTLSTQVSTLQNEARTAEQRAAEIAASMGVDGVKTETTNVATTREEHIAEYRKLSAESPAKAAAYWEKNLK